MCNAKDASSNVKKKLMSEDISKILTENCENEKKNSSSSPKLKTTTMKINFYTQEFPRPRMFSNNIAAILIISIILKKDSIGTY